MSTNTNEDFEQMNAHIDKIIEKVLSYQPTLSDAEKRAFYQREISRCPWFIGG